MESGTQTQGTINFLDSSLNHTVTNQIHRELLEFAGEALDSESYENRSISSIFIGIKKEDFAKIRKEIKDFREEILNKYQAKTGEADVVATHGVTTSAGFTGLRRRI